MCFSTWWWLRLNNLSRPLCFSRPASYLNIPSPKPAHTNIWTVAQQTFCIPFKHRHSLSTACLPPSEASLTSSSRNTFCFVWFQTVFFLYQFLISLEDSLMCNSWMSYKLSSVKVVVTISQLHIEIKNWIIHLGS